MAPPPTVHCPSLATSFIGIHHPASSPECPIQQFRGIKFAHIPARFRQSSLNTTYPTTTDARTHGPISPQIKRAPKEDALFGFAPEEPIPLLQDEFECLNLVITRPAGAGLPPHASLPVMIWIHGGANITGSGSSYLYDPAKFIQASMEIHQPVIVVNINYRLGLLGFAASEALEEANRLFGETGVGNYGLNDQLNAIAWIRRYISHFGGDPSTLTLFGSSTGAMHIHALLLSRTNHHRPLVSRAILQSGVLRPAAVRSVAAQGGVLHRVMARVGAGTIEELRSVPVDVLIGQTPISHGGGGGVSPTDDGIFFRDGWREWPVPEGVHSLILGDCTFESAPWAAPVGMWTTTALIRRARAVIRGAYKADRLLRTYGMEWSMEDEEAQEVVLRMLNDVLFAWPVDRVARAAAAAAGEGKPIVPGSSMKVYRYAFDQESPLTYTAHHGVDVLYLFDNVPPKGRKSSLLPTFDSSGSDTSSDLEMFHPAITSPVEEEDDDVDDDDTHSDLYPDPDPSPDLESDNDDDDDYRYYHLSNSTYNANRVKRALQERWIGFAQRETIDNNNTEVTTPASPVPWADTSLFVFGPEGEVGERPLEEELVRRRRVVEWEEVLESVGAEVLERLAVELAGGPPTIVRVGAGRR